MKLAEALIERAETKKRLASIASRMNENAITEEGETPDEAVADLRHLYEHTMDEMNTLICRINKTNHETKLGDISLADAIAKRDCIKSKINVYRELKQTAVKKGHASGFGRWGETGVKIVRTVDTAELQKSIDKLSREYRELDTNIQRFNWNVELL